MADLICPLTLSSSALASLYILSTILPQGLCTCSSLNLNAVPLGICMAHALIHSLSLLSVTSSQRLSLLIHHLKSSLPFLIVLK